MNVYKRVVENINGVATECVLIKMSDYTDFMLLITPNYDKIKEQIEVQKVREEKHQEVEDKRVEQILQREKAEQERLKNYDKKIELEMMENKHTNERIKKEKNELKEAYKEIFDANPQASIHKCNVCDAYKVYPNHFLDENDDAYVITYKNKQKIVIKRTCCATCYDKKQEAIKKNKLTAYENRKIKEQDHRQYCEYCDCHFIDISIKKKGQSDAIVKHIETARHKRNENLKLAAKKKAYIDLSYLNLKQLHSICSKTLADNGCYLIAGYTRMKKDDLVILMNKHYDKLVLDLGQ
jgi:hypothetical protein